MGLGPGWWQGGGATCELPGSILQAELTDVADTMSKVMVQKYVQNSYEQGFSWIYRNEAWFRQACDIDLANSSSTNHPEIPHWKLELSCHLFSQRRNKKSVVKYTHYQNLYLQLSELVWGLIFVQHTDVNEIIVQQTKPFQSKNDTYPYADAKLIG